jgi:hypothetical protein
MSSYRRCDCACGRRCGCGRTLGAHGARAQRAQARKDGHADVTPELFADGLVASLNASADGVLVASRGGVGFVNMTVDGRALAELRTAAAAGAAAAAAAAASVPAPPPRPPAVPHTLVVDMVPAAFDETCFKLYKKYQARCVGLAAAAVPHSACGVTWRTGAQMAVHHDSDDEVTRDGYTRFLCSSPLIAVPCGGATAAAALRHGGSLIHCNVRAGPAAAAAPGAAAAAAPSEGDISVLQAMGYAREDAVQALTASQCQVCMWKGGVPSAVCVCLSHAPRHTALLPLLLGVCSWTRRSNCCKGGGR